MLSSKAEGIRGQAQHPMTSSRVRSCHTTKDGWEAGDILRGPPLLHPIAALTTTTHTPGPCGRIREKGPSCLGAGCSQLSKMSSNLKQQPSGGEGWWEIAKGPRWAFCLNRPLGSTRKGLPMPGEHRKAGRRKARVPQSMLNTKAERKEGHSESQGAVPAAPSGCGLILHL